MKHIQKRPFDIFLPGSKDKEPEFLETIEVEVENKFGEEFLTQESRQRIETIRARHMGLMTGEDIKNLRGRLKLSQKELTDLLQCGEKSLSRWENGHGLPTGVVNALLRLLDEDRISIDCLRAVQGPRRSRWAPQTVQSQNARKQPFLYIVGSNFDKIELPEENAARAIAA